MLTAKQMTGLKKANASTDVEKSTTRIIEDFKATSKSEKDKILSLSGLSANAYYNVSRTKSASPRVILSLAQILNVSPLYYTGEINEKETCSDEVLDTFFKRYMNKKAVPDKTVQSKSKKAVNIVKKEKPVVENKDTLKKNKSAVKTTNVSEKVNPAIETKNANENEVLQAVESLSPFTVELDNSERMVKAVRELDADTAALLLKALMKRAEAGGKAEALCDIVKRCLLS